MIMIIIIIYNKKKINYQNLIFSFNINYKKNIYLKHLIKKPKNFNFSFFLFFKEDNKKLQKNFKKKKIFQITSQAFSKAVQIFEQTIPALRGY